MKPDQALNIVKQACANLQADLGTHTTIQQAIGIIEKELALKPSMLPVPEVPISA